MKSTTGAHYLGLDHVRALATFIVVAWHFTHGVYGYPVAFNFVPAVFPLALLDEGHVGVALFMTLSGYLFAKLLDGKEVNFASFWWNRMLRLMPLLLIVIAIVGFKAYRTDTLGKYLTDIVSGVILPTLPNGAWSITVEFHFYLVLPVLLWMNRRSRWAPLAIVFAFLALRTGLHVSGHPMQPLSYWTIVGRMDQFALGMFAFMNCQRLRARHLVAACSALALCVVYTLFDAAGGFYNPTYPSKSLLWVVLPTIEGLCFAVCIAWYDTSFHWQNLGFASWVGKAGEYSYSIYLLHVFLVFKAAALVNERVMSISNFYVALVWAGIFFLMMMPLGYLSYRFIELPFLRLRTPYIIEAPEMARTD